MGTCWRRKAHRTARIALLKRREYFSRLEEEKLIFTKTSEASSPTLRKPNNDYEALDHLIRLNKNENNLPLDFLEDSAFFSNEADKPEATRLPIERTSSSNFFFQRNKSIDGIFA